MNYWVVKIDVFFAIVNASYQMMDIPIVKLNSIFLMAFPVQAYIKLIKFYFTNALK